ncbi:MAG: hypothetical protein ABSC17_03505 [Thermacetogeniaceae bacterium]
MVGQRHFLKGLWRNASRGRGGIADAHPIGASFDKCLGVFYLRGNNFTANLMDQLQIPVE